MADLAGLRQGIRAGDTIISPVCSASIPRNLSGQGHSCSLPLSLALSDLHFVPLLPISLCSGPPTLTRRHVIYYTPRAPFQELVSGHTSALYYTAQCCGPKRGGKKGSDYRQNACVCWRCCLKWGSSSDARDFACIAGWTQLRG